MKNIKGQKTKKYKLLLINPRNKHRKGFSQNRFSKFPPLNLAIIAALTPDYWDVEIIDEQFDEFEFKKADLIGITAFTAQIKNAYDIAGIYKNKNIPVIIGGVHVSIYPDEALKYADSIVTGESEGIWRKVIQDFENNQLKKKYDGKLVSMEKIPAARHDLLHPDYIYSPIQTTRGCPMQCEFCSVHLFNGKKFRTREVNEVIKEMKTMPSKKEMAILDDNIIGYSLNSQQRAIKLFKAMIKNKIDKIWLTQASINFADNEDVLKYAYEAGCRMVLIGIESEKEEQLREQKKNLNLNYFQDKYEEVFHRINKNGISVLGTFIFGLESDNVDDLHERADFIINSSIDCYQTSVLTPVPGTTLYERIKSENRLIDDNYPDDWQKYHAFEVVMKPKQMTAETLKNEMNQIWHKIYSKEVILKKFLNTKRKTKNKIAALWALSSNINYRNITLEGSADQISGADILNSNIIKRFE